VILSSYFDESGTHDASPVTIMAGILGNAGQWIRFQKELDGLNFGFVIGAVRCFGGVLKAFRSARWKRSAMPGSSTISTGAVGGFCDRVIASQPTAIST
jgi:hypothetical protein